MRAMPPILLSEATIKIIMKITYIMGSSFTNLRSFFYRVSILNILSAHSRVKLYACRVNYLMNCHLFMLAALQLVVVVRKTAFSEFALQEAKNLEV